MRRLVVGTTVVAVALALASPASAATPTDKASPNTYLLNGQQVTVTLAGFQAGETVYIAQCTPDVVTSQSPADCSAESLVSKHTDSSGTATLHKYKVRSGSSYSDGDGGVCDAHHPCLIIATNSEETPTEFASTKIKFASKPVKTVTSVKPKHEKVAAGKKVRLRIHTKLSAPNGPFAGAVKISDNGKKVGKVKLGSHGTATFKLKVHKGDNKIVAKYAGGPRYRASIGKATLTGK